MDRSRLLRSALILPCEEERQRRGARWKMRWVIEAAHATDLRLHGPRRLTPPSCDALPRTEGDSRLVVSAPEDPNSPNVHDAHCRPPGLRGRKTACTTLQPARGSVSSGPAVLAASSLEAGASSSIGSHSS